MANAGEAGTFDIADMTVNRLGFGAMRIMGKGVWGEPPDREAARAGRCAARSSWAST